MDTNNSIFSLPDWLDLHRKQAGLDVKNLCLKVGISRQSYYYYLRGKYHPNEQIFNKLKEVLASENPKLKYDKFKRASKSRGWRKGRPRKRK